MPRVKTTRIMATFKGHLQLGNPAEYDTAVRIPVERYYRTYVAKPPSASQFVLRSELVGEGQGESSAAAAGTQESPIDGSSLIGVRNVRTYQITDETAPGGKRDVEREDLAKGYEYGRTAVYISETDQNITVLETYAAIELLGFIQSDTVSHFREIRCITLNGVCYSV